MYPDSVSQMQGDIYAYFIDYRKESDIVQHQNLIDISSSIAVDSKRQGIILNFIVMKEQVRHSTWNEAAPVSIP